MDIVEKVENGRVHTVEVNSGVLVNKGSMTSAAALLLGMVFQCIEPI